MEDQLRDVLSQTAKEIHFKYANLLSAKLSGFDFRGVSFEKSNLKNADLSNCDLREANFWDACLMGANLEGANLAGAIGNRQEIKSHVIAGVYITYTSEIIWINEHKYSIDDYITCQVVHNWSVEKWAEQWDFFVRELLLNDAAKISDAKAWTPDFDLEF